MPNLLTSPKGLMIHVDWQSLSLPTKQSILNDLGNGSGPAIESDTSTTYEPESYPINVPQIRQLVEGIDEKTTAILKQIADSYDEDRFDELNCWIDFADAWKLAGVTEQAQFAKGTLSGLHRRLGTITGEKTKLVLTYEQGGSDGNGSYYIDNRQAVLALREYFKLK